MHEVASVRCWLRRRVVQILCALTFAAPAWADAPRNPNSFEGRVSLADEASARQDFPAAVVEYKAALELKDDRAVRIKLSDMYRGTGAVQNCLDELLIAKKMSADDAEVELKLAFAYMAVKDVPSCILSLEKAAKLKPDNPDVENALISVWQEVLGINPLSPNNHIGLAQAYEYHQNYTDAEQEYKQAIRFSPKKQNAAATKHLEDLALKKMAGPFNLIVAPDFVTPDLPKPLDKFSIGSKTMHLHPADSVATTPIRLGELASASAVDPAKHNRPIGLMGAIKTSTPIGNGSNGAPLRTTPPTAVPLKRDLTVVSTTTTQTTTPSPNWLGKGYAVLIATNTYDSHFPQLKNPIQDARDLEDILKNYYGWNTTRLENPTRDQILTTLADASNRAYRPQDQLFVYVAGHGIFDKTLHDGAIVTTDSKPNDHLKNSYVLYSTLKSLMDRGNCSKVLLTLDVCFGGSFLDQIARPTRSIGDNDIYDQIPVDQIAKKIQGKTSRRLLTPGADEPVYEGVQGGHSPLAKHLLAALRSCGGSKGYLRFTDIQRVAEETKPGGVATSFSEADDPLSDFLFVPKRK